MKSKGLITIAFIILVLAICYGVYTFMLQPLWQQNQDLRDQTGAESQRLANLVELARYKPLFDTKTQLYQERLAVLDKMLPAAPNKANFYVEMQRLIAAGDVKLQSLSNLSAPTQSGQDTISTFQLTVSGNYFKVMTFLRQLLSFPNLLAVRAVSISGSEDVTATLDCAIYLKPTGGK